MELEEIRQEIDEIDQQLVSLLETRMGLILEVVAFKKKHRLPVLDNNRENEVLNNVLKKVQNHQFDDVIRATFKDIMTESRVYQKENIVDGD
ncbi:TPA: chorismate mutase [Streptococcus agalactiae]